MIKYKIGEGDFVEKGIFFERLEKALHINNQIDSSRYTMSYCEASLEYWGYVDLYVVKDMPQGMPFFMADEEVFKMQKIIHRSLWYNIRTLSPIVSFCVARELFKNGCRVCEGITTEGNGNESLCSDKV